MACILGSATPSIPRQRSSNAPHFWGSPIFMPTLFNAERSDWSWNSCGERHVFRRSAAPLHLHKCVAWFENGRMSVWKNMTFLQHQNYLKHLWTPASGCFAPKPSRSPQAPNFIPFCQFMDPPLQLSNRSRTTVERPSNWSRFVVVTTVLHWL